MIRMGCLLLALLITVRAQNPLQKRNLEKPTADRFTLTDRVWPVNHGEADVCLWEDDKSCAISITIDDNPKYERDWWIEMGQKYGFQVTWMLITSHMMNGGHSFFGDWDAWRYAFEQGMECQSHTINHICTIDDKTDSTMHWQYYGSQKQLNDSIPGNRALAMAGPCGKFNHDIGVQYWIANRGTRGTLDAVNRVDYMNTGVTSFSMANIKAAVQNRSWMTILYHGVAQSNLPVSEREKVYERMEPRFAYMKEHAADIWGVGFARAAQYGQSRDTHTLTVDEVTADLVRFTLTDSMNDTLFDQPLTVKVRLDDAWSSLAALQAGDTLDADLVFHEGAKYALVKAVPDGGEVRLERIEPTVVAAPHVTAETGRYQDTVRVSIYCMTDGAELRYTLDGSEPDGSDLLYSAPLVITDDVLLMVKGFKSGLQAGPAESLAIAIERVAPELSAAAAAGSGEVIVTFNEPVDSMLAVNVAAYAIDKGITVSAAELLTGAQSVLLTVSAMTEDTEYTLAVAGIRDLSNNLLAGNTETVFTYAAPPSDTGLTGYWSFDEADGAPVVIDGSGNGNTGVVHSAGFGKGMRNNALVLEGSDDSYIDLGRSEFGIYQTQQLSIAFWYKIDNMRSGTLLKRGTYTWPYSFTLSQADKTLKTGIRGASGSFWMSYEYPDSVEYDTWYHVAISHGDSNISYYLNGELVASYDTVQTMYKNGANSLLGLGVGGMIDELRIYNIGISADDVAVLYADTTVDQTTEVRQFSISNCQLPSERLTTPQYYRINGEMVPVQMKQEPGIYLEFDGQKIRKRVILE